MGAGASAAAERLEGDVGYGLVAIRVTQLSPRLRAPRSLLTLWNVWLVRMAGSISGSSAAPAAVPKLAAVAAEKKAADKKAAAAPTNVNFVRCNIEFRDNIRQKFANSISKYGRVLPTSVVQPLVLPCRRWYHNSQR